MHTVYFCNILDEDFGYDCGPQVLYENCDAATARSIVKHLRKVSPDFVNYWWE